MGEDSHLEADYEDRTHYERELDEHDWQDPGDGEPNDYILAQQELEDFEGFSIFDDIDLGDHEPW